MTSIDLGTLLHLNKTLTNRFNKLSQLLAKSKVNRLTHSTPMEIVRPALSDGIKSRESRYSHVTQRAQLRHEIHVMLMALQKGHYRYLETDDLVAEIEEELNEASHVIKEANHVTSKANHVTTEADHVIKEPQLSWDIRLESLFHDTSHHVIYPDLEKQQLVNCRLPLVDLDDTPKRQSQKVRNEPLVRFDSFEKCDSETSRTRPGVHLFSNFEKVDFEKRHNPPGVHVISNFKNCMDLPLDIKGLIFDCIDLETCVILRQVSSAWYTAFRVFDGVLKTKVIDKSRVLEPGKGDYSDLVTWGDCALVFVGRLKNKKWTIDEDYSMARTSDGRICIRT